MDTAPLIAEWDGEAFCPLPRYAKECDNAFVVHQRYRIEIIEERSAKAHKFYFASLKEAWDNLPEDIAQQHPSVEHLRKSALCAVGHCNEMQIACSSNAEARRTVATIKALDSYAVCAIRGNIVLVRTARSQSTRAMGRDVFMDSMRQVLDHVASLIGVSRDDLQKARAA